MKPAISHPPRAREEQRLEEPGRGPDDEKAIEAQARRLLNKLVIEGDLKRAPSGKLIYQRSKT
jgi:hypothetical protein